MPENTAQFISRFQNRRTDEVFHDLSYWFAFILFRRFILDGAKIMYDTRSNRFGTFVNGRVFDITGDVTDECRWILWTSVSPDDQKCALKTQN